MTCRKPGNKFVTDIGIWMLYEAHFLRASPVVQLVKNLPAMQETQVQSLGQEDPLEKGMQPTPVFLPGEFHRQRSLLGYSLWNWTQLSN